MTCSSVAPLSSFAPLPFVDGEPSTSLSSVPSDGASAASAASALGSSPSGRLSEADTALVSSDVGSEGASVVSGLSALASPPALACSVVAGGS